MRNSILQMNRICNIDVLHHNTHGIIDQLIGLCMYLNLDYISSKKRPTVDESTTSKWLLPITPRTELRQQWIES